MKTELIERIGEFGFGVVSMNLAHELLVPGAASVVAMFGFACLLFGVIYEMRRKKKEAPTTGTVNGTP